MKNDCISRIIIISLCVSNSAAYGLGINIPSVAALLLKSLGGIAAIKAAGDFDTITHNRPCQGLQLNRKFSSAAVKPSADCAIKNDTQSWIPLLVTTITFISIITVNVRYNSQTIIKTDLQEIETEKA